MSGAPFHIHQDQWVNAIPSPLREQSVPGVVDRGGPPRNRRRSRRSNVREGPSVQRLNFSVMEEEVVEEPYFAGDESPRPMQGMGRAPTYSRQQPLPPRREQYCASQIYEDPNISYGREGVIPGLGLVARVEPMHFSSPGPPQERPPTMFHLLHATRGQHRRGRRVPQRQTPRLPVVSEDEMERRQPNAGVHAVTPLTTEDLQFMQNELRRTRDVDRQVLGLERPYQGYSPQAPPTPARGRPSPSIDERRVELNVMDECHHQTPQTPPPRSPMGGINWDEMQLSPLNEEELAWIRDAIFTAPPREPGGTPLEVATSRSLTRLSISAVGDPAVAQNASPGPFTSTPDNQQISTQRKCMCTPGNMERSQQKSFAGLSAGEEFPLAASTPIRSSSQVSLTRMTSTEGREVYEEQSLKFSSENYPSPEEMRGIDDLPEPFPTLPPIRLKGISTPANARRRDYAPASEPGKLAIEHNVSYKVSMVTPIPMEQPSGTSPPPPSSPEAEPDNPRESPEEKPPSKFEDKETYIPDSSEWFDRFVDCFVKKIPMPDLPPYRGSKPKDEPSKSDKSPQHAQGCPNASLPSSQERRLSGQIPASTPIHAPNCPIGSPALTALPPPDISPIHGGGNKQLEVGPYANMEQQTPQGTTQRAASTDVVGDLLKIDWMEELVKSMRNRTPFPPPHLCKNDSASEERHERFKREYLKFPRKPINPVKKEPEVDELDKCLNEHMAAQSSWLTWRAEVPPKEELPPSKDYNVQKRIIPTEDIPESVDDLRVKFEMLNTEFMYYASLLKKFSPNLKEPQIRRKVAYWVKKLFGPQYHVTPELQDKRNRYLMALTIGIMSNDLLRMFREVAPTGDLGEPDLFFDDVKPARWEGDELWHDVLSGLPDPGVLEIPCGLHLSRNICPESGAAKAGLEGKRGDGSKEKDVKESALLDKEYRFFLHIAKDLAAKLENPFEKTSAATWLHALSAVADDSTSHCYAQRAKKLKVETWPCPLKRGVRNDYMQALLSYLVESRLDGPFLEAPPRNGDGGPLPTLKNFTQSAMGLRLRDTNISPTSSLADKFLFKQPIPKDGAFAFVALNGDSLNLWFPDCKEQGDGSNNNG